MRIKSKDLLGLRVLADDIKDRAGRLQYNVRFRRVTHTLASVTGLAKSFTELWNKVHSRTFFYSRLRNALYQSQVGPTEIVLNVNGQVFIQGTFDLERLRKLVLVNDSNPELTLEVAEPGK